MRTPVQQLAPDGSIATLTLSSEDCIIILQAEVKT
jgi:hypothetical protein